MSEHNQLTRWAITVTQIVVSVCLLGWLLLYADFADTKALVATISPKTLILCTVLLAVLVIPASIRWRWFILRFMTEAMPKPALTIAIRINSVNVGLNQFLPSTIGGDFYRVLIARSLGLPLLKSMYATLADRLTALVVLVLVSGPALVIVMISAGNMLPFSLNIFVVTCVVVVCLFLTCWFGLRHHPVVKKTISLVYVVFGSARAAGLATQVVLTSLVIQLTTLFVMTLIARAIGIDIDLILLIGIMAASLLASRLPISIAGWGVREGLSVSLFGAFGVSAEPALATSILYGLTELAAAMVAVLTTFAGVPLVKFFVKQPSS